ncbi:MAG: type I methionyl aminopeptidase [Eubacterium sp.]|nr:type I methionyl aminopeptidase [Eubacterium sp.]
MAITIKNDEEIELMRKAGQILARVHADLAKELKEGMTTKEIDRLAYEMIFSYGGIPNFLNYNGFPASVCVSVNEEVVHGIPSEKRFLRSGDIVSIDGGVLFEGYHSDAARTYGIGEISEEARKLITVTEDSFFEAIKKAKPGNHIVDIGKAVQTYALSNGYSVVRDLTGHGIGTALHEAPNIPNYKTFFKGPRIRKGMTLAVEPMINMGNYSVTRLDDNWTYATADGTLSAHYENTIAVTDHGCEILTMLPEEQESRFGIKQAGKEDEAKEEKVQETIVVSGSKESGKAEEKNSSKIEESTAEADLEAAAQAQEAETKIDDKAEKTADPKEAEMEDKKEEAVPDLQPETAQPATEKPGKAPFQTLTPEEKRARRELLFEDD